MNDEQKKLVYRLYKKGKKNLSNIDRIIIEANPEIKDELTKLINVNEGLYEECNNCIEKALSGAEKEKQKKRRPGIKLFPLITIPASLAAGLLIILQLVLNYNTKPIPLGSKISIFISHTTDPDRFYRKGSSSRPGEKLQLAFQAPIDIEDIRQGILFSVGDGKESYVHYRFDSERDKLNQSGLTMVEKKLMLTGEGEYVYFVAYFSDTLFDEQELIDNITKLIRKEREGAEKILSKKYRRAIIDFTYLKKETH